MTEQEIIQLGKNIEPVSEIYSSDVTFLIIFFTMLTTLIVGTVVGAYIEKKGGSERATIAGIAACVILAVSCLVLFTGKQSLVKEEYSAATTEWKEAYAYPYIRSLDYTDLELTTIRENNGSQESEPNEIIEYRDDDQIVKTLNTPEDTEWDTNNGQKAYQLIYDVPAGEKPYVRLYKLTTNLGHGMKPGAYGLDIHLNEKQ